MSFARLTEDSPDLPPQENPREPFSGTKTNIQADPFSNASPGAGSKDPFENSDPFSNSPDLKAIKEEIERIHAGIEDLDLKKSNSGRRSLFKSPKAFRKSSKYAQLEDDHEVTAGSVQKEEFQEVEEEGGWSFAGKINTEKKQKKWSFGEDPFEEVVEPKADNPFENKKVDNPFENKEESSNPFETGEDPFSSPVRESAPDPFGAREDSINSSSFNSNSRSLKHADHAIIKKDRDPFGDEIMDSNEAEDPFGDVEIVDLKDPDDDPFEEVPKSKPARRKSLPYSKKGSIVLGPRRASMPNIVGIQSKADEAPIFRSETAREPESRNVFLRSEAKEATTGYQMEPLSPRIPRAKFVARGKTLLKANTFSKPVEDPFATSDPFMLPTRDDFEDGGSDDDSSDIFVPPPPPDPDNFSSSATKENEKATPFTPIDPSSFLSKSNFKMTIRNMNSTVATQGKKLDLSSHLDQLEKAVGDQLSERKEEEEENPFEIDIENDVAEDGAVQEPEEKEVPLAVHEAIVGETYRVFRGATTPPSFLRPLDALLNHQVQLVSLVHRFACYEVDFQNENWLVPFGWLEAKNKASIDSNDADDNVFDYFLVVKFVKNAEGRLEPRIEIPISVGKRRNKLLSKVPAFCFPDILSFIDSPRNLFSHNMEWERHTFTLTGQSLDRLYGFCRRFISPHTRYPMAICLITKHPLHDYFEQLMDAITLRWNLNPDHGFTVLQKVLEVGIPDPDVIVRIPSPQGMIRLCTSSVCNINLEPLFRSLSVDSILFIISCILTERRMVFHSQSLQKVSDVIHGLLKLLYPFEWQQVCIPILPKSLMHYVGAPMPFIIGVQSDSIDDVSNYGVSTIILVDIDQDVIVTNQDQQTLIGLPSKLSRKLRKILIKLTHQGVIESIVKSAKKFLGANNPQYGLGFDNEAVAAAFLTFMFQLVGDWRGYDKRIVNFDLKMDDCEKYLQVLKESQFFNYFLETRRQGFVADRYEMLINLSNSEEIESFAKCYEYIRSIDIPRRQNRYERLNVDIVVDAAVRFTSSENARASRSKNEKFDPEVYLDLIAAGCDDPLVNELVLKVIDDRIAEGVNVLHFNRTMKMCLGLCMRKSNLFITHLQKRTDMINQLRYYALHSSKPLKKEVRETAKQLYRFLTDVYSLEDCLRFEENFV